MMRDGILVLNKPQNWTSHDCVAICRRILRLKGIKKIGHGGTLDPMAEGVLPIFIGQATRIMEYLDLDYKRYTCELQLGITTDTQDIWGQVLSEHPFDGITESDVLREMDGFRGLIDQMPPLYSAVRVDGKRLYEYAYKAGASRKNDGASGKTLGADSAMDDGPANAPGAKDPASGLDAVLEKVQPRKVHIRTLEIHEIDLQRGRIRFSAECSKGTYIRTICADLGQRLGCGAAMRALTRTAIGAIDLSGSVSPEEIKQMEGDTEKLQRLESLLLPADGPLKHFGKAVMPQERARYFRQGNSIRLHQISFESRPQISPDPRTGEIPCNARGRSYDRIYRVYQKEDGLFLGTGYEDRENRVLKADKVFTALNEPKKR